MLKVLIVEDNIILADFLEDFLISQGYDVCGIADNVDEAARLIALHKPDLGVLDYRLANGENSSQICSLLKDKSMGILYVSGDPLRNKLTSADGDACIQKPYGMHDLICALNIVHDIKINKTISTSPFPKGFYLLEGPREEYRKIA